MVNIRNQSRYDLHTSSLKVIANLICLEMKIVDCLCAYLISFSTRLITGVIFQTINMLFIFKH